MPKYRYLTRMSLEKLTARALLCVEDRTRLVNWWIAGRGIVTFRSGYEERLAFKLALAHMEIGTYYRKRAEFELAVTPQDAKGTRNAKA